MSSSSTRAGVLFVALATLTLAGCGAKANNSGTDPGGGGGGGGGGGTCSNGTRDPGETDVDCGGPCLACGDGRHCVQSTDCASAFCGPGYVCWKASCNNNVKDAANKETDVDCGGDCPLCFGDSCSKSELCGSGYCKDGACAEATCTDGVKNGKETGADCGGADCPACPDGQGCLVAAHCTSGFCNRAGKCATPACDDGEKNGDETDQDCGGSCGPCADGKVCTGSSECRSGKCSGGVCTALAGTCDDGQKNGTETDTDCGGECTACGFGKGCVAPADCKSELCKDGACTAPASCSDATLTPGETDVDCGGKDCPPCGLDKACKDHVDCVTIACIFGKCAKPTCDDEVKNGKETDADCGGPDCPKCGDGGKCAASTDCVGGTCTGGFCGSCTDQKMNGNETDVDCGGSCDPCATGQKCGNNGDCQSATCDAGLCASCTDGAKNGSETGVDCGGACGKCGLNQGCKSASDCESAGCEAGVCCAPNACGECTNTPTEICNGKDDDCNGQTDDGLGSQLCPKQDGVCAGSQAKCLGALGWVCSDADYAAYAAGFQANETRCDSVDNDCDGATDEDPACAVCKAAMVVQEVTSQSGNGEIILDADFFALVGTEPQVVLSYHAPAGRDGLHVTPTKKTTYAADVMNGGGIATDGVSSWVGYRKNLGNFNYYVHVGKLPMAFTSELHSRSDVPDGGHPTPLAFGGGKLALVYVDDNSYHMKMVVSPNTSPAQSWTETPLSDEFDQKVSVRMTSAGAPHVVWREGFGNGALVHWSDGTQRNVGPTGGVGALATAMDPQDRLHVVWHEGGKVQYSVYEGGAWAAATPAGTTTKLLLGVATSPEGTPYVAWAKDGQKVVVARKSGAGFEQISERSLASAGETLQNLAIGVDAAGVIHLAAAADSFGKDLSIRFLTTCAGYGDGPTCTPACAGKQCGPDGCGGTCGACTGGKSCNDAGQCVTGCTPNCSGKQCGANGCGGTCGTCAAGKSCTGGQCVTSSGLQCDDAGTQPGACTQSDPCMCLGCKTDGVCDPLADDCVCPDCKTDSFCSTSCAQNGICSAFAEGCQCPDCAAHPSCQ